MTSNINSTGSQQNVKITITESENTLQSVSTVKNIDNFGIKEIININNTDDCKTLETSKKSSKRPNSTVAALTNKLTDIKSFKLSKKSNKHQRIVLKAVAKAPKRDIIINKKLFPFFNRTLDSDLGVLPAILTKNKNTLLSSFETERDLNEKASYVLKKDISNNYFPDNDPLVNFSNPIELPITSTPAKQKENTSNDLEKMVGDMEVYSMNHSRIPRSMKTTEKDENNQKKKTRRIRTVKIDKVSKEK